MSEKLAAIRTPQHTCCICRKSGEWTESWAWYGSVLDAEGGGDSTFRAPKGYRYKPIKKFCSRSCREKGERRGWVPPLEVPIGVTVR
jgi:hypothetical protein